ncbi:MAG TPA: VWA domain-containing protein [Phycisphaerae bacterium]|nr:VWA domain-containing protein [Phycisphaerae bacterium]
MDGLFHPDARWVLLLLLFLPVIWWRVYLRRPDEAMRFSSVDPLRRLRPGWRVRLRWLLPVLRSLALILLIVAIARPRKGNEQTRIRAEGIAIGLIVDRSGSMQAMDFTIAGKRANRLAAVQNVVRSFVLGDDDLKGRPDDLIGLIAFGTFADSKCPLTLDHSYLIDALDRTEIAKTEEEGQTAIGDAVALGVEQMRNLQQSRRLQQGGAIRSRVLILLTDGQSNAGDIDPLKAAEMAATFGIRVYTIGAGTRGLAPVPALDPFTGNMTFRQMPVDIDEETLGKIADATGGRYFRATDTDSLRKVYAEIDKLEKTETEERRFLQYRELATEWTHWGRLSVPPVLLMVFVLLGLEVLLSQTWLRRLP